MTQRLRDNQALRDEVRRLVYAAHYGDAGISNTTAEILDAVDRALTATGPGSGAPCEACATIAKSFDEAKAKSLASYHAAHPAAPQTDHWAARPPGSFTRSVEGFASDLEAIDSATPPSGSPPGAAEPRIGCKCTDKDPAKCTQAWAFPPAPCDCVPCHGPASPPEPPDGSRGTR